MKALLLFVLLIAAVSACQCSSKSISESWEAADDVVMVAIVREYPTANNSMIAFEARVTHHVYKGCSWRGEILIIHSPVAASDCGFELLAGRSYQLYAKRLASTPAWLYSGPNIDGLTHLLVDSCSHNQRRFQVSDSERRFLAGRPVCCGSEECFCNRLAKAPGPEQIWAHLQPCQQDFCASAISECGEPSFVRCENNRCNCRAEFFTETGQIVCERCASDADCRSGQFCHQASNRCRLQ